MPHSPIFTYVSPSSQVIYHGIDVSYNPNETEETILEELETSTRRKERVDLVWNDLQFAVPIKAKSSKDGEPPKTEKIILKGMTGYARAGTMLAVMGSSGAGKTSLLNLLAGRITTSKGCKASGQVYVNGKPRDYTKFRKLAAYVLQDDDMFAELTVEEQLNYAALLRLPADMPREKKLMRVQKVIQELSLTKVKDTQIGNEIVRGISGGERKRVNIGTELVTDPALLFLDEPTSGLDSFNALNVMTSLRRLASNGRTIVSTIHQPRSSIFALFDQLCLLSEGRVMYFGPAKDAIGYFASLSFASPAQFNPADFFLDLLSVDPRSPDREANTKARVEYLGNKHVAQEEPVLLEGPDGDLEAGDDYGHAQNEVQVQLKNRQYQTSWVNEFGVLINRSLKLAFREKMANYARLGQVIFFSVILGLIWLNNGRDNSITEGFPTRQSLAGVLFFIVINQAFGGIFSVIFGFPLERSIVTRERSSNMYRTSSYFLSKSVTDLPKTLVFNVIFCSIVYWMIGLRPEAGAFFIFIVIIFVTSILAEALAIAVSVVTGDAQAAAGIIPVFVILALLFGGFFIGNSALPAWIGWGKWLSFVFYAFNALGKNEFADRDYGMPALNSALEEYVDETFNQLSVATNIIVLVGIFLLLRTLGYLLLQFFRAPKFLKF